MGLYFTPMSLLSSENSLEFKGSIDTYSVFNFLLVGCFLKSRLEEEDC